MSLLQMSFAGAVMITAVIIIRALAVNRLPKKTFLILWGIVLMRLLVPFSIPSELSVYSLAQRNMSGTLPGGGAVRAGCAHRARYRQAFGHRRFDGR